MKTNIRFYLPTDVSSQFDQKLTLLFNGSLIWLARQISSKEISKN